MFEIITHLSERKLKWNLEINHCLKSFAKTKEHFHGEIQLVDGEHPELPKILSSIDRKVGPVVLVVSESFEPRNEYNVDDYLVYPFRTLELISKFKILEEIKKWEEVSKMNLSFQEILEKLKEDVSLIEKIQQTLTPKRFNDLKEFNVTSRYLGGNRSGGDFFDIAESRNHQNIYLLLSDSSSYGLSRAILTIIMKVALKLGQVGYGEHGPCWEWVEKIFQELTLVFKEKDTLSLFYGVISRNDYHLKYLNIGNSRCFYAPPKSEFKVLSALAEPLNKKTDLGMLKTSNGGHGEIILHPESRLVLLSDGFLDVLGGDQRTTSFLNSFRESEPFEIINEFTFQSKSKLKDPDDLPEQDCSGIIIDLDLKLMKIA